MQRKAYACTDCGRPAHGTELSDLAPSDRAALRDGNYLCSACKEKRQLGSV